MESYDVAVAGYGPTGMVAASLLGRRGLRVVVVERWPALYGLPRLTHIDDESARIVQAAGDARQALEDSTPTEYVWVNGDGETLLTIPVEMGDLGYPTDISMYQPDVERSIDERIRTMPNVEVLQGWTLRDLQQDDDGVVLHVARSTGHDVDATQQRVLRAAYLIGADGSKSLVRELLDVTRDDLGFNERWVNVDVEWLREPDARFGVSKQHCDPARGHMFMGIGRRRERFEYAIVDGDDPDEIVSEPAAWAFLERMHGLTRRDVRIVRRLAYTFEARIARRWRVGRVFLAGDAAHTMPPYLGQGACAGMRDAANLAWKLAAVLRGAADDSVLDTYEQERRPHATSIVRASIELGRIANVRDAEQAARRDAAFRSGDVPPPPARPPLHAGVLAVEQREAGVPVGSIAPQGVLEDRGSERLADDVLGCGFVLISRAAVTHRLAPRHRAVLDALDTSFLALDNAPDVSGRLDRYLLGLGAAAALVRPDFVLYGVARTLDDVPALVDGLGERLVPDTVAAR